MDNWLGKKNWLDLMNTVCCWIPIRDTGRKIGQWKIGKSGCKTGPSKESIESIE